MRQRRDQVQTKSELDYAMPRIAVAAHALLFDDDLAAIHTYLKQKHAPGRDDFRAMVETKTWRFAGIRPAHRPPRTK